MTKRLPEWWKLLKPEKFCKTKQKNSIVHLVIRHTDIDNDDDDNQIIFAIKNNCRRKISKRKKIPRKFLWNEKKEAKNKNQTSEKKCHNGMDPTTNAKLLLFQWFAYVCVQHICEFWFSLFRQWWWVAGYGHSQKYCRLHNNFKFSI